MCAAQAISAWHLQSLNGDILVALALDVHDLPSNESEGAHALATPRNNVQDLEQTPCHDARSFRLNQLQSL